MRDVRDEPALHPGQVLELVDLSLQARRHLVEGAPQPGDIVLTADLHPSVEPAGGELLGRPRGQPDRRDHLPDDDPRDGPDQGDQGETADDEDPLDPGQDLYLVVQTVDEVQLVLPAVDRPEVD